jgi:ubiquinone biosynthesis protein
MDVIKTGLELKKTLQNVGRLREILSVLAVNGFDEFIYRTKLHDKVPNFVLPKSRLQSVLSNKEDGHFWQGFGFRLRKSFEQLGPGFIKLGQLIATREDLLDPSFIKEMKKLQNEVKNLSFENFEPILRNSLGTNWRDNFKTFNTNAIATASISSVFEAELNSGQKVVVKVRKPQIKKVIDVDFSLFKQVISQIENISEEFRFIGLSRLIDDFHRTVLLELNFNIEKRNLAVLTENISKIDTRNILKLPLYYAELSSEDCFVMEFLDGKPFNQIDKKNVTSDLEEKLLESTAMFLETLMSDGFFHADLHGGNFLLLEDGNIGIIDFGSVGNLNKGSKASLVSILYSLTQNNYERLVYEFLDIAQYDAIPDTQKLIQDMQYAMASYVGLSAKQINVLELMGDVLSVLQKHKIFLPREWFIIFRAIATLDGVGRSLGLDINIFDILKKKSTNIVSLLVNKKEVTEEALWLGRDFLKSLKMAPKHLSWFLSESAKRNYTLMTKSTDLSNALKEQSKAIRLLGVCFLSGVLMICGTLVSLQGNVQKISDFSKVSLAFFFLSVVTLVFGYLK